MLKQNKQPYNQPAVTGLIILLVAGFIYPGCKKPPAEPTPAEQKQNRPTPPKPVLEAPRKPIKSGNEAFPTREMSLKDIITAARTWEAAYKSWHGKTAPEFTLPDITGKLHKLSDYRGKTVLVIFWATWCPPCRREIPDLMELRKTISENRLAMLAITNEKPELVKTFVANQKINYTVLLDKGDMPQPFGFSRIYRTSGVPCSFFIDPQGKIKLATAGLLSLDEIKAILRAKPGY